LVFDGEPVTIDLQYRLAYFFISVMICLAALIDFLSGPVKKESIGTSESQFQPVRGRG